MCPDAYFHTPELPGREKATLRIRPIKTLPALQWRQAWHWKIYSCYAVLEERLLLGIGEYGCTTPHPGTGVLGGTRRECSLCLCLEEPGFCLVCVKLWKLLIMPHLCHTFTARSHDVGLWHFTISLLELLICRYLIDRSGGLAFLHPVLILFSTSCSKTDHNCLGWGLGHL